VFAYLEISRRQWSRAVDLLELGVARSRELNLTLSSVLNTGLLGYAYALMGRLAESIALLEQGLSDMETMGYGGPQPLFLAYLSEAYVLAGRHEGAFGLAGRALTLVRQRGRRPCEASALRLLGEVSTRRDAPTSAVHYRDALALAEELGMRPLVAHCHLGLGKLYRRTGKRDQAEEHLTTATAMYSPLTSREREIDSMLALNRRVVLSTG
jgi:tetratricopeptide (TPR) repeat protein